MLTCLGIAIIGCQMGQSYTIAYQYPETLLPTAFFRELKSARILSIDSATYMARYRVDPNDPAIHTIELSFMMDNGTTRIEFTECTALVVRLHLDRDFDCVEDTVIYRSDNHQKVGDIITFPVPVAPKRDLFS
jgi:hypothetical protein